MSLGKFQKADEMEVHNPDRHFTVGTTRFTMSPMRIGQAADFLKAFARIRNIMLVYAGPSVTPASVAQEFPTEGLKGEELKAQITKQQEALANALKPSERVNDYQAAFMNAEISAEILPMLPHCITGIEVDEIPAMLLPEIVQTWLDQNLNDEILKNWWAVDNVVRLRSTRVSDFVGNSPSPGRSIN